MSKKRSPSSKAKTAHWHLKGVKHCHGQSKSDRKGGFALILSLALVSFIVLLVISLATLVQLQLRTASQKKHTVGAKLNAELAAKMALGDLQKYVGPDQRITARADILEPPTEDPVANTAHWTGVWSSDTESNPLNDRDFPLYDDVPVPAELERDKPYWLVSGDTRNYTNRENKVIKELSADESIKLASLEISVKQEDQEVVVLKEPILSESGDETGEFAYWVSDEGVKARINLDNPHLKNSDPDTEYYNVATALQTDASTVSTIKGKQPFLTGGISPWKVPNSTTGRLLDGNALDISFKSNNKDSLAQEFFHDFTYYSKSVLADVRNGGLKMDLSTALLNLKDAKLSGPMFPPIGGTESPGNPGGPKWEQLADYYQLTHDQKPGAKIKLRLPTNDEVGIAPVVTRFNFVIQTFAQRTSVTSGSDDATDYTYTVGMFPLITLWNPYDRDLEIPDLGLQTDMRGVYLIDRPAVGGGYFIPEVLHDLAVSRKYKIGDLIPQWQTIPHTDEQNRGMIVMTIEGTTIPAGKAINFSPPNNSYINWDDATGNVLKPGASAEFIRGFFSPSVRPTAPPPGRGGVSQKFPMRDGTGVVNVCFAPRANVNQQIFNVYSEAFNEDPDTSKRMLAIVGPGMGQYYANNSNWSPRVIIVDDLGIPDLSWIESENSSASTSFNDISDIYLPDIYTYGKNIVGVSVQTNFVNSDVSFAQTAHLLSQMNPRAQYIQDQLGVLDIVDEGVNPGFRYRFYAAGRNSWDQGDTTYTYISGTDSKESYVGLSNRSVDGNDRMILFESPVFPPLGIGQFMHANLQNIFRLSHGFLNSSGKASWNSNQQQPVTYPAYAIGNSAANIHLPLHSTGEMVLGDSPMFSVDITRTTNRYTRNGWEGGHYDYSYLLNDRLWDSYYMSTIPPKEVKNVKFPLPNTRITRNGDVKGGDLAESKESARHLMLQGGFNINSTSVSAWESVLGAMRDIETLGQPAAEGDLVHNYSRFTTPKMKSTGDVPNYKKQGDAIVGGFRNLTDDQIKDLANSIVTEIRTRSAASGHPFQSLSSFINRSIDRSLFDRNPLFKRFAYEGPLQYAITQAAMNGTPAIDENGNEQEGEGLWEEDYIADDIPSDVTPFLQESVDVIKRRPYLDAAPGALTQADVLAKIGASLTPRSDTFVIRSYGMTRTSVADDTNATAYCEMVVQRTPAYLDNEFNDEEDAMDERVNRTFGRKFKVVAFRWLNSDEI